MDTRYALGGLLAAAILSSPVLAQTNPPARTPAATTTDVSPKSNHWRASKVIGVNIYNEQGEKLGDIREVILDPSGKVTGYVIGVGGFLGMGEHDVLVEPGKIKFVNEPRRTATTTTTTPTTTTNPPPATAPAGTPNNPRPVTNTGARNEWYPDHGILSATKDQLKAMQQFKY
jgi:sporulation protein YlmC with PRC-barrel domain